MILSYGYIQLNYCEYEGSPQRTSIPKLGTDINYTTTEEIAKFTHGTLRP